MIIELAKVDPSVSILCDIHVKADLIPVTRLIPL
jgi:hypothetical protein